MRFIWLDENRRNGEKQNKGRGQGGVSACALMKDLPSNKKEGREANEDETPLGCLIPSIVCLFLSQIFIRYHFETISRLLLFPLFFPNF